MVEASISKNTYLSAVKLHQALSVKRLIIFLLSFIITFSLGIFLVIHNFQTLGNGLVGGSVGAIIGYLIMRFVHVPIQARRIYKQQKSLHETYSFSWSSQGLGITNSRVSSTTPWSNYFKWRENDLVFNLYHSDSLYQVIPKSIFKSEREEIEFRNFLSIVKNA